MNQPKLPKVSLMRLLKHLKKNLGTEAVARRCSVEKVYNFIKKETLGQVFSCEFCKIFKSNFLQNTSGWLLFKVKLKLLEKPDNIIPINQAVICNISGGFCKMT